MIVVSDTTPLNYLVLLLELEPAINALKRKTYRVRPEIIQAALERDAARKRLSNP